jgi:thioredoxin 1
MNNLTKQKFMMIFDKGENLTKKPILLDFYADWCGPCKTFKKILDEVTPEYENKINMFKVDVDAEKDIANLFQIRSIPKIVTISVGGEVDVHAGNMDKYALKYFLEGLTLQK